MGTAVRWPVIGLRHRALAALAAVTLLSAIVSGLAIWSFAGRVQGMEDARAAGAGLAQVGTGQAALALQGAGGPELVLATGTALPPGWVEQVLPLPPDRVGDDWPASVSLLTTGPGFSETVLTDLNRSDTPRAYFEAASETLFRLGVEGGFLIRLDGGAAVQALSPDTWRSRPPTSALVIGALLCLALLYAAVIAFARWLARPAETLVRRIAAAPGKAEIAAIEAYLDDLEAERDDRDRERVRMLAAMSHDLHTPITRLRLKAEFVEDAEQRTSMQCDLEEVDQMVSETLRFLRGEDAREEFQRVDLTALVETICDEFADMGQPVQYHPPPPLSFRPVGTIFSGVPGDAQEFGDMRRIRVDCRARAIRRALTNLIRNAVTYGGRADVRLDANAQSVTITVADRGPGIAQEDVQKVLKPFARLEGSRNRDRGGAGLGLAVVASVAKAHGGEIAFHREEQEFCAELRLPR